MKTYQSSQETMTNGEKKHRVWIIYITLNSKPCITDGEV